MYEHTLENDHFYLRLVFEKDFNNQFLTDLTVFVKNEAFAAKADLVILTEDFVKFTTELKKVYDALRGEAIIKERVAYERYISFRATKTGHIVVEGFLCDDMKNNELRFINSFDQTFLKQFSDELWSAYSKYGQ